MRSGSSFALAAVSHRVSVRRRPSRSRSNSPASGCASAPEGVSRPRCAVHGPLVGSSRPHLKRHGSGRPITIAGCRPLPSGPRARQQTGPGCLCDGAQQHRGARVDEVLLREVGGDLFRRSHHLSNSSARASQRRFSGFRDRRCQRQPSVEHSTLPRCVSLTPHVAAPKRWCSYAASRARRVSVESPGGLPTRTDDTIGRLVWRSALRAS
jgi:hypothetical protein